MAIVCLPCSQLGTVRGNPICEAPGGEDASRNASELDSSSLHHWERSTFRICRNLPPAEKQQTKATAGFPGEIGGSAHRQIDQEPGRPNYVDMAVKHSGGNHNPVCGIVWESEKPIVVLKWGNACGTKGLYCRYASIQREGDPLV